MAWFARTNSQILANRLILANRFRVEPGSLFCDSRFGGLKSASRRFEAIRANRAHVMKKVFFFFLANRFARIDSRELPRFTFRIARPSKACVPANTELLSLWVNLSPIHPTLQCLVCNVHVDFARISPGFCLKVWGLSRCKPLFPWNFGAWAVVSLCLDVPKSGRGSSSKRSVFGVSKGQFWCRIWQMVNLAFQQPKRQMVPFSRGPTGGCKKGSPSKAQGAVDGRNEKGEIEQSLQIFDGPRELKGLVPCSFCHLNFVKEFPRFGRKISVKSRLISANLG